MSCSNEGSRCQLLAHRYIDQRMGFAVAIGVTADIEGLAALGVSVENDPLRKSGGQNV